MTHPADPHPDLAKLGDHADGLLPPGEASAVDAHLARCAPCAAADAELRGLLAAAAAAPASIEPQADLWPAIHARLAVPTVRRPPGAAPWWRRRVSLAAAVLVAVASSAVTAALLGRRDAGPPAVASVPAASSAVALPARFARLDGDYAHTAGQLAAVLDRERASLDPATVAALDRSLRTIDQALAEAREALARDPRNAALVELYAASYEQKLDLLRRAAELPSPI